MQTYLTIILDDEENQSVLPLNILIGATVKGGIVVFDHQEGDFNKIRRSFGALKITIKCTVVHEDGKEKSYTVWESESGK